MTNKQLLYFSTICHCNNNINQAANLLNISKSTLSQSLCNLEKEFDLQFFYSDGKNKLLTAEGIEFLQQAQKLLDLCDDFTNSLATSTTYQSIIRIGVSRFHASLLFPVLHEALSDNFPDYHFIFQENMALDLFHALNQDELDIILSVCKKEMNLDSGKYRIIPVNLYEELILATNIHNPLANKSLLTMQDLVNENLLFQRSRYNYSTIANHLLAEHDILHKGNIIITDQLESVFAAIKANNASSIIARTAMIPDKEIAYVPLDLFNNPKQLSIITLQQKYNSTIKNLIQYLLFLVPTISFKREIS